MTGSPPQKWGRNHSTCPCRMAHPQATCCSSMVRWVAVRQAGKVWLFTVYIMIKPSLSFFQYFPSMCVIDVLQHFTMPGASICQPSTAEKLEFILRGVSMKASSDGSMALQAGFVFLYITTIIMRFLNNQL